MTDLAQLGLDFGPLQTLIANEEVTEIFVNGPQQVYVERCGTLERVSDVSFADEEQIITFVNSLLLAVDPDCQVSQDRPYADTHFSDGSRLLVTIPPIAISGPNLTIRKFMKDPLTIDDLKRFGSLSAEMAEFIAGCVRARLNLILAGGIGSGKTTLFNIIASFIPVDERIVTVEDEANLQLKNEHVVSLESKLPNWEGQGGVNIKELLWLAARMRPDRILVSEVYGSEAMDVLQLMTRGYNGTLALMSANSPQEALERLEMMVKMGEPNIPIPYVRSLIGSAIDLVVQQLRLEDGSRKVIRISEVVPIKGGYEFNDVFVFHREGRNERGKLVGRFQGYPISANLMQRLEAAGVTPPANVLPAMGEGEASQDIHN